MMKNMLKSRIYELKFIKRNITIIPSRLRDIYQRTGYEKANINPLENTSSSNNLFEVYEDDVLEKAVLIGHKRVETVNDLNETFKNIYCSKVGFEISHLPEAELIWLSDKIESTMTVELSSHAKKEIAKLLLKTEAFDLFMQRRFNQVKRYGLEGCESAAVVLDFILKTIIDIDHVMITMPHRGRLNLMTVLMNYPAEAIFHKLAGNSELPENIPGSADVLSHLSLQKKIKIGSNENGLVTLLPNPSHLEAGNSVGLGAVYAYQNYRESHKNCLSIQFHGDAAFTGQGVVAECLQLSQLPNFKVNGTIHVICNNQLGFTTAPEYGRSSKYASDPAKAINIPIIHVNADCPEDVAKATFIAVEYQRKFKKDVVIDLIGWRKMGHNELDEPMFTQPLMYQKIQSRRSTAQVYSAKILNSDEVSKIEKDQFESLETAAEAAKKFKPELIGIQKEWKFEHNPDNQKSIVDTGISKDLLIESALRSVSYPEGFSVHQRLKKHHIEHRIEQMKTEKIDWATAESMAIGSLLAEGFNVRFSGQDVARGTFSHRHLKFVDQNDGKAFEPFDDWKNGKLEIAPSNLSEFGVLGFEYGVSIVSGNKLLPIWEAQFGDFFNGAQIIFDTFISSGEAKWGLFSNLTVILPHGYDGAGPEHSSCRLERFLQSCDESKMGNLIVTNPTTPANYFHLLRRQLKRNHQKPLIIVGPKTLLRSPHAISKLSEFTEGTRFEPILIKQTGQKCDKLIFVSGKFYYDVLKEFEQNQTLQNVTIIRLEELNPFPRSEIVESTKNLVSASTEIIWCQEEPKNMGAYSFIAPKLTEIYGKSIKYVGRSASAAPATGISKQHKEELSEIYKKLK